MSYPGLVFIHFQCAVHKLQEVRGGYQIIFQYNGASVCIDLCGNSVNNTSCQTIVLFTFYDVYLFKSIDGVDKTAHFVYRFAIFGATGRIRVNKQLAFGSQSIVQQCFYCTFCMCRTVIYK